MALFCAAIKRDSVSLLSCFFVCDIQVSWSEISFICCLKCPYCCFSSLFCFSVISVQLILVLYVFLSGGCDQAFCAYFMIYSSFCNDVSMLFWFLASPLFPSFVASYNLSKSSLGHKSLCIFVTFLFLWSICWFSSLVQLRNSPDYLTKRLAQVFIPFMIYLLSNLVSSSFLVLLR